MPTLSIRPGNLGMTRLISPEFQRIEQTQKMASEAFVDHHWYRFTLVSKEAIHVRPSISGCELYSSVRLLSWWPVFPQLSWTLSLEPFSTASFVFRKHFLVAIFLAVLPWISYACAVKSDFCYHEQDAMIEKQKFVQCHH